MLFDKSVLLLRKHLVVSRPYVRRVHMPLLHALIDVSCRDVSALLFLKYILTGCFITK